MKKHLVLKAFILLVVMFFHSFVLIPKAHATTWEGIAGRLAFRGLAPSVIGGMAGGMGIVAGIVIGGGIGYIAYKSGAVTALKNWWAANPGNNIVAWEPGYGAANAGCFATTGGGTGQPMTCGGLAGYKKIGNNSGPNTWWYQYWNNGNQINSGYPFATFAAAYIAAFGYGAGTASMSTITVPTDYSVPLGTAQPSFPSNTVYASPGAAAALSGGAAINSIVQMSDSDIDKFISGTGSTAVASDGSQVGNPSTTDNTVTAGDSASIGLLQQILNYVSNLIGIKTSVDSVKTSVDNAVVGINQQSVKLDNVVTGINSLNTTMDNVGVAIQNQTAILDGVGTDIAHMDNTLSGINTTTATVSTLQTRIDALSDAAAVKFPFSLVSSIGVSAVSGTSSYAFASLPLTASISIPIEPMIGPLSSLFSWIRQLLVWFFWLGTLFAILRKGMEM